MSEQPEGAEDEPDADLGEGFALGLTAGLMIAQGDASP